MQYLKSYFGNAFNFNGRARRKEYWMGYLWYVIFALCGSCIIGLPLGIISGLLEIDLTIVAGLLGGLYGFVVAFPLISLTIRRLHDIGKSGWWYLICALGSLCCGIGSIVMFIFTCLDSEPGDNQWGPNPKGIGGYNGGFNNTNQFQQNPQYGANMNQQYNQNNNYGQNNQNF